MAPGHVPASVRGALALSSNPPSRHEKLIHSRNANIRCSPFTSGSPQERIFGQCRVYEYTAYGAENKSPEALPGPCAEGQHARGVVSSPLRTSHGRGV